MQRQKLPCCVFIQPWASFRLTADSETHTAGGLQSMSLLLYLCHCTANGTHHLGSGCRHTVSNLGQPYIQFCARVRGVAIMDGCPHPPLPLYGQQTKRCSALGVALHDYWPILVCMQAAARCHGTESSRCYRKDGKLASESCTELGLSEPWCWCYLKWQVWFERAVGLFDHVGFIDSSNITPGGL